MVTVHGLSIDQTPVAKSTALSSAALGSSAEIIARHARARSLQEILTNQPQKADIEVRGTPPQKTISRAEFDSLQKKIEETDQGQEEGISLNDIQTYKP